MPSRSINRKHQSKLPNKKHHNRKNSKTKKTNKKIHTRKHTRKNQRGGFYSNSCSLATVQEAGFTIPAIGDVPGFSLSDSKGAIHRPNCKSDTYQAMTP